MLVVVFDRYSTVPGLISWAWGATIKTGYIRYQCTKGSGLATKMKNKLNLNKNSKSLCVVTAVTSKSTLLQCSVYCCLDS